MDEVVGTDAAEFEKKKGDPELAAMSRIAKTLDGLTPDVRFRVVAWLRSRYAND